MQAIKFQRIALTFFNALRTSSLDTFKIKRFINVSQTVCFLKFAPKHGFPSSIQSFAVRMCICIILTRLNLNSAANANPLAQSINVYWFYFAQEKSHISDFNINAIIFAAQKTQYILKPPYTNTNIVKALSLEFSPLTWAVGDFYLTYTEEYV